MGLKNFLNCCRGGLSISEQLDYMKTMKDSDERVPMFESEVESKKSREEEKKEPLL